MAIDFDMMSVVAYCLLDAKHNKKDFDRDFNRFIVKEDMLSIATNKAQAEGRLDEFLSYVDNQVAVNVVYGCDDKSRLSVAIENAYLAESVRAKLYGNDSFGDVAHAVYEKFEGKIIPEEFVGSAQYVNNFIKGSFGENNLVYALSDKISEKEVADGYLLDTERLSDWELDTYPIYDVVDAYRLGAYERFSSEREEHIDLISYANDLDTFESTFDCRKYAGGVVKSRLRSVLESSFEREFVQASSRVYFNKNLNGGNLNLLKDATTYFMDNKLLFDKVADTHVVDGMMRDKLTDVAKDVLGMSCDKVMRGEDRAQVICGVGLEQFYRDHVGKFAGTRVIQSFVDNDKIKEPGKSKFYGDLREYLDAQTCAKYDSKFGAHKKFDGSKYAKTKRKVLNVPFDADADKQSTDDDDFDK